MSGPEEPSGKLPEKLVTDRTFTCNHVQTPKRSVCHQLFVTSFSVTSFSTRGSVAPGGAT
jgi:uncharacterized OB-fold protein